MELKAISTAALADFFRGGAANLSANKERVNALNVFPVPDGDTGINMFLTINSAVANITQTENTKQFAMDFSMGALMGARGNSGVILSQILRGFAQGLPTDKKEISAQDLAAAFQKGVDLAYKSVMKPTEGTILTVFRHFAAAAQEKAVESDDILEMFAYALEQGEIALANTPELLPVLKEAGVVDAGGRGLLYIMEGGYRVLSGEEIDFSALAAAAVKPVAPARVPGTAAGKADASNVEFIYCTELRIHGEGLDPDAVKKAVLKSTKGDCLLVVGSDTVVKIHYHNNNPGKVLAAAVAFGSLHDLKIENMLDQHTELSLEAEELEAAGDDVPVPVAPVAAAPAREPDAKCGVIAICSGEGMAEIFRQMGAAVLQGGQTMNPAAEDILKPATEMNTEEAVILPNNSNIILTANQVQALTQKKIGVVNTKFVTQGIAAMIEFDAEASAEENAAKMTEAFASVRSGELTYAVRDSKYAGMEIAADDLLALAEGNIIAHGKEMRPMLFSLIDELLKGDGAEDLSLISLFYGNDMTEAEAQELLAAVEEHYPDMDIDMHEGGQPLYYFLVLIE